MTLLLVPVVVPVIAAIFLLLLPETVRRAFISLCLLAVGAFAVALLAGVDFGGQVTLFSSAFGDETGVTYLSFSLHPIGKIALFGFALAIPLGLLFGLEVTGKTEQAVALFALAGASGVALADNFLTFLFFWEVLSITSATMIFLKRTEQAITMAYRVLVIQLLGGLALTVGIVLHYHAAGSFALAVPAAGLPFFIIGIGVKAAFLPLHVWVPWGYPVAPFQASVLLAALCTKAGVFAVARILPASEGIALMGATMSIVAVSFALVQHDMRRLLSVHIVSQVGYMVAGIGLGNYYGVDGGMLHMANNMVYKSLLFMCAGAVLYCTGTEDLHKLHHPPTGKEGPPLWRSLPLITGGAVVGALAIAGAPLFNGYISKYLLKNAAYGVDPVETILLVAGVGTALSFTKFLYFGFFKAQAQVLRPPKVTMTAAIAVAAGACILFGAFPQPMAALLPNQTSLNVYSAQGISVSLQVIAVALVVFALMRKVLERGIHAPQWANSMAQVAAGTAHSAASGTIYLLDYISAGMQQLVAGASQLSFKAIFTMFQKLDYRPGESRVFRFINVRNLEFDIMLVIIIFGVLAVWYLFMTLQIQITHTNPF